MNLTKLTGWASGFNWYKLGIYAVLFLSWTGGVYSYATHRCEIKHEQEKTVEVQTKLVEVIKEVEVRIPVVQIREVESAKQRAEIKRLKEKLDEAINGRADNPNCDLSDAEFNSVQDLAEQTRS